MFTPDIAYRICRGHVLARHAETGITYQGQNVRDVCRYDLGQLSQPRDGFLATFSAWRNLVRGSTTREDAAETLA